MEDNKKKYWDLDFFSIFEENGKKYIKFWGYFYSLEGLEGKPCRLVECCNCVVPLKEFVKNSGVYEGYQNELIASSKQYITDITEDEAIDEMNTYYNGDPPIPYPLEDVTIGTPCGDYVDARMN